MTTLLMLQNSLSLMVLLPLSAAVAALLVPHRARLIAILCLFSCTALIMSWLPVITDSQLDGGITRVQLDLGNWPQGLGIALRLDPLTLSFLLMTNVIGLLLSWQARHGLTSDQDSGAAWSLWLLLFTGLNVLLVAADLFNIYIGLELVGISAVALCLQAQGLDAMKAAGRYLVFGLLASLLFLTGVVLTYTLTGTLNVQDAGRAMQAATGEQAMLPILLFTVALFIKSALFPCHFWLPPAHSGAPAIISAALSALVVKVAIYLQLRLWLELFPEQTSPYWLDAMTLSGALAILWGGYKALRSHRLKLMAAYSTVGQVGYLFVILSLALQVDINERSPLIAALVLLAITHAFAKSALFLSAGAVYERIGHDRIRDLTGMAQLMPLTSFTFALAGIALIGLPPSGGFLAKWQLISVQLTQQSPALITVVIGTLLSCAAMFRLLSIAMIEPGKTRPEASEMRTYPALFMALIATLVLGLAADPLWSFLTSEAQGGLL